MATVWTTVANSSAARRMNLFIVGSIEKFCHCVCKALSWFTDHADLMHGKPTTLAPIVRRGEMYRLLQPGVPRRQAPGIT